MRRASVETIEKLVQSKADQARERRVSLTIMNCIWARNTERETTLPVHGEVVCKQLFTHTYYYVFVTQLSVSKSHDFELTSKWRVVITLILPLERNWIQLFEAQGREIKSWALCISLHTSKMRKYTYGFFKSLYLLSNKTKIL